MAEPVPVNSFADRIASVEQEVRVLKTGGTDGTYGGMEARVAKLEAHMEHVRSDLAKLASVPADLSEVKARINALPDKDWVGAKMFRYLSAAGVACAIVSGLIGAAFKFIGG